MCVTEECPGGVIGYSSQGQMVLPVFTLIFSLRISISTFNADMSPDLRNSALSWEKGTLSKLITQGEQFISIC